MPDKKVVKKPTEEKVVMTKTDLDSMQADIDLLKKSVSRYKIEEQQALRDKDKVEKPRGHLKRIDGKLVEKWMGLNEAGSKAEQKILYQGTTPVGEIMIGHYKTFDDEDLVCEAIKFYRSTDLEYFTKLGEDGDEWTIAFDNPELPQNHKINVRYVNP